MRGTGHLLGQSDPHCRITPACAGNSTGGIWGWQRLRDHPRVCGEQLTRRNMTGSAMGSPPRVRGTAQDKSAFILEARITPACAGNSYKTRRCLILFWDHPRVCGEQVWRRDCEALQMGSPPRVRGTVPLSCPLPCNLRITPAGAGNRIYDGD